MTEQNNDMTSPFTEIVTNKIKKQDEQIAGIEEKLKTIPDTTPELIDIKKQLAEIKVAITAIKFPTKQMDDLSGNLAKSVAILKQPIENKIIHHHHIPKIIMVSAALFLVLCLLCSGWYNTAQNLDQYRINDLKYRYLKLKTNPVLQRLLAITDSLFQNQPDFDKAVLQGEDSVRELIQNLVDAKEQEVNYLKRRLK
jgi:hypothetical protein